MSQKARRIRLSAIVISLLAGVIIFSLKLYAANISNSSAIRSDALEGAVNIVAAAFGLFSIIFSEKPADEGHPYGHGKIEHFAAVFEGGLISLAGFLILLDTSLRYLNHSQTTNLENGLIISIAAGCLNGVLGLALYWVGKKYSSTTLRADGLHLLSDLGSTLFLGAGLGLAILTGWMWIDPILAVLASIMLFIGGYKVIRPSWNSLLDAMNPESIQKIVDHLNQIKLFPVITIHELKSQEFGRDAHVDLHLVLPEFYSIKDAHHVSDKITETLRKVVGEGSQIHAHIDPCARFYCSECAYEPCSIRRENFVAHQKLTAQSIVMDGPI